MPSYIRLESQEAAPPPIVPHVDTAVAAVNKTSTKKKRKSDDIVKHEPKTTKKQDDSTKKKKAKASTTTSSTKKKAKKDPNKPKGTKTAYNCYYSEQHSIVSAAKPELSSRDVTKKVGEIWGRLSVEEKVPYEELAATDKERYNREMEVYNASLKVDGDAVKASTTKKKKQKKTSPKKKKQQSKKKEYNHVGSIEHAYNLPPSPQKMKEAAAAKSKKLNSSIVKKVVGDKLPNIMPQKEYFLKLSREKKQQKMVVGDGSGLKDKKASPFLLDANVAKGLSEIFKAGELDEPPAPSLTDNDTPTKGLPADMKQKENHANTAAAGSDDDSSTASSDSILNEEKGLQSGSSRKLDHDGLELDNAKKEKVGVNADEDDSSAVAFGGLDDLHFGDTPKKDEVGVNGDDQQMEVEKGHKHKEEDVVDVGTDTAVANNLDVDGKTKGIDSGKAAQVTAKKDRDAKHPPREAVATLEPSPLDTIEQAGEESTTSATVPYSKQNRVSIEPGDLPSTPSKPSASVENTWTLNLRPLSKEDTDRHFTEKKITYEEPDYLLPGGREYCVERKVIEKSVSDTNHQAKVVLGRNRSTGIEWGAVSRALCEVCLTPKHLGDSPNKTMASIVQLTMKKPAQEHALHVNGRKLNDKTKKLKNKDVVSLYGPLGFAYLVEISENQ